MAQPTLIDLYPKECIKGLQAFLEATLFFNQPHFFHLHFDND